MWAPASCVERVFCPRGAALADGATRLAAARQRHNSERRGGGRGRARQRDRRRRSGLPPSKGLLSTSAGADCSSMLASERVDCGRRLLSRLPKHLLACCAGVGPRRQKGLGRSLGNEPLRNSPGHRGTRRAQPSRPLCCSDWLGSGPWPRPAPDARSAVAPRARPTSSATVTRRGATVLGRRRADGAIAATQRPARRVHVLGTAIRDEIDTTMLVR